MKPADIKRRLAAGRRSQQELADFLGISVYSANRLLNDGRELKASEIGRIEAFFKSVGLEGPQGAQDGRIPVYGFAAASNEDRIAWTQAQILDWIDAPDLVSGVDAAVRIVGDSMEPRLFAGEMAYLRSGLQPRRGQDCVVELANDEAIIKTYEARRDGHLLLRQYNPETELKIPLANVRAVHAVLWRG